MLRGREGRGREAEGDEKCTRERGERVRDAGGERDE